MNYPPLASSTYVTRQGSLASETWEANDVPVFNDEEADLNAAAAFNNANNVALRSRHLGSAGVGSSGTTVERRTKNVILTSSGRCIYTLVESFARNLSKILSSDIYGDVVGGIHSIFDSYISKLADLAADPTTAFKEHAHYFAMIANIVTLTDDLLPRIIDDFKVCISFC